VAWVDLVVVKTSEEITKTSVEVAEAVAILVITLTEEPEEEAVVIWSLLIRIKEIISTVVRITWEIWFSKEIQEVVVVVDTLVAVVVISTITTTVPLITTVTMFKTKVWTKLTVNKTWVKTILELLNHRTTPAWINKTRTLLVTKLITNQILLKIMITFSVEICPAIMV
jgi:hypothetical protein